MEIIAQRRCAAAVKIKKPSSEKTDNGFAFFQKAPTAPI